MFERQNHTKLLVAMVFAAAFGGEVRADTSCTPSVPRYHADTQELHLAMVRAGHSVYTARLRKMPGAKPVRFELVSVRYCQVMVPDLTNLELPHYDITSGELILPRVEAELAGGQRRLYFARLKRVGTHPLRMELSRLQPAAGEVYTVGDTIHVNTLIGYGEVKPQTDYSAYIQSESAGGDILWGADLGLPVTFQGADPEGGDLTLYLFGDTDQLDRRWLESEGEVRKYRPDADEHFYGPKGPFEGDAIGLSNDDDPGDGVWLSHIYRERDGARVCGKTDANAFRPVYLDNIHGNTQEVEKDLREVLRKGLPQEETEKRLVNRLSTLPPAACIQRHPNTTPTGAWAVDGILFMMAGIQKPKDPANARSYLAVSADLGLNWKLVNGGLPFSEGGVEARFLHAFGLEVDARDYQDEHRSGPCKLPLPEGDDKRGVLLFGTGLWKASDVYLAFLSRADLLEAAAKPAHRIKPWYFSGTDYAAPDKGIQCWSRSERDAEAIIAANDHSHYARFEDACGAEVTFAGVGYAKPIHVDETLADGTRIDRLVMLLSPAYKYKYEEDAGDAEMDADLGTVLVTGDPLRPWLWNLAVKPEHYHGKLPNERRFRPLPVPAAPDSGLAPTRPDCRASGADWATVSGYAPLLIDRYTRVSADGQGIDLYFLVSRWDVPSEPRRPEQEGVEAYHYVVDVMRTTLRPAP